MGVVAEDEGLREREDEGTGLGVGGGITEVIGICEEPARKDVTAPAINKIVGKRTLSVRSSAACSQSLIDLPLRIS